MLRANTNFQSAEHGCSRV